MTIADVMIVEDNFIIQHELEAILEDIGYRVVATASEAEEAQKKAEDFKPDIILMDIQNTQEAATDTDVTVRKKSLDNNCSNRPSAFSPEY